MSDSNLAIPDFSIIIPAYNEQDELPETLRGVEQALARCPGRPVEVIVVDNSSTDATADLARAAGARVVAEPEHRISTVRNTGARAACGRYLIFLDADTRPHPGLFAETLRVLDSGTVCGGGAAVLYDQYPNRLARFLVWIWGRISRRRKWAAGSYVFCPREAFNAVGGFDQTVYYSEEIILSRALARWGRPRKMKFIILPLPVLTSPRKFQWFSNRHILLSLLLAPLWHKNKAKSSLWYTRPQ